MPPEYLWGRDQIMAEPNGMPDAFRQRTVDLEELKVLSRKTRHLFEEDDNATKITGEKAPTT